MTEPPQQIPFRQNRPLQAMLIWLLIVWVATAINPINRLDWLLENLLVIIYGILLTATYSRFKFSNTSYALFTLFMTLHLIGAHYTYAETPFGFWLQEWFNLQRNHYDRIAHFSYGLLCAYPIHEVLTRSISRIKTGWACFLAVTVILSFSAFFEVVEAIIAVIVSPELGDAYLGTQGDIWDAQRDMFLAFSGAAIAMLATWRAVRKKVRED